jgi:hypothetical protein
VAIYLYCLTEPACGPADDLRGIGDAPVRAVSVAERASAWVSDLPEALGPATAELVRVHDRVVRAALSGETPLPARFGQSFAGEDALRRALEARAEAMEQALERVDAYLAADIRFHAAVAEATRNRLIRHLMEGIRERLEEMFGAVYRYPVGPERSVAQHRRIAEAIGNRDATLARSLMIEHIERVEHELAALQA